MRWTSLVLVVAWLLTGCANESTVAADCALAVRYAGATYNNAGFTEHDGVRLGDADGSSCDDVGPDSRGAYFPQDTRQVGVWSFEGFDPSEVIGSREPDGSFRVYLVEELPDIEAEKIQAALARAHSDSR